MSGSWYVWPDKRKKPVVSLHDVAFRPYGNGDEEGDGLCKVLRAMMGRDGRSAERIGIWTARGHSQSDPTFSSKPLRGYHWKMQYGNRSDFNA